MDRKVNLLVLVSETHLFLLTMDIFFKDVLLLDFFIFIFFMIERNDLILVILIILQKGIDFYHSGKRFEYLALFKVDSFSQRLILSVVLQRLTGLIYYFLLP